MIENQQNHFVAAQETQQIRCTLPEGALNLPKKEANTTLTRVLFAPTFQDLAQIRA